MFVNTTPVTIRDIRPGMIHLHFHDNGTECYSPIIGVTDADVPGSRWKGKRVTTECGMVFTDDDFVTEYVADLNFS